MVDPEQARHRLDPYSLRAVKPEGSLGRRLPSAFGVLTEQDPSVTSFPPGIGGWGFNGAEVGRPSVDTEAQAPSVIAIDANDPSIAVARQTPIP